MCVCSGASRSKTFEADEDDETLATETLREISALRLMRGKNGHSGILRMLDVIEHEGEGTYAPRGRREKVENDVVAKRNVQTNPAKLGGFGVPNTLIGGNHEYMHSPYDAFGNAVRSERKKDKEKHGEKKALAAQLALDYPAPALRTTHRMCVDCHDLFAAASLAYKRRITCQDPGHLHVFEGGRCSCGGRWRGQPAPPTLLTCAPVRI